MAESGEGRLTPGVARWIIEASRTWLAGRYVTATSPTVCRSV
jgi:hypothetical protein